MSTSSIVSKLLSAFLLNLPNVRWPGSVLMPLLQALSPAKKSIRLNESKRYSDVSILYLASRKSYSIFHCLIRKLWPTYCTLIFAGEYLGIEPFYPPLISVTYRRMPSVDEIKLYTDLASDSLRSNRWVEDITEIFLRVKKPC